MSFWNWEVTTPINATTSEQVPLNTTKKAVKITTVSVWAWTASPSWGLVLDGKTKAIIIQPSVSPTAPIFVNFGEWANVNASATVADRVLTEWYFPIQEGRYSETTHISLFSANAQSVYVIELE